MDGNKALESSKVASNESRSKLFGDSKNCFLEDTTKALIP